MAAGGNPLFSGGLASQRAQQHREKVALAGEPDKALASVHYDDRMVAAIGEGCE